MSYYLSNHMDEASAHFFTFLRKYPGSRFRPAAWFFSADAFFQKHDWVVARNEFSRMEQDSSTSGLRDIAILRQAWINAMQYKWVEAADLVKRLNQNESSLPQLDILEKEYRNGIHIPSRSPVFAGILSAVVPGSGQIYANRYADGLVAFFSMQRLFGVQLKPLILIIPHRGGYYYFLNWAGIQAISIQQSIVAIGLIVNTTALMLCDYRNHSLIYIGLNGYYSS
jgi:hypothetical protein